MRSITSSLAVFIAVLLGACGALGGAPASDAEQSVPRRGARSTPPAPEVAPVVEPHQMPNGERSVFGTASVRPTPDGSTVLSGTFIDDDGRPVEGARVWTAPGWSTRSLQSSDYIEGPTYQNSPAETGADGRFLIRAPRTWEGFVSLLARKEGHSELALTKVEIVPGHELDLGIRVLRRGVPIEVEFVDATGAPVEGVGLAQVWRRGSVGYIEWHGASDSTGVVRTASVPSLDAMRFDDARLMAAIPGQALDVLSIEEWKRASGGRLRHVLPPRRWIEGKLINAPPGKRFAISTGDAQPSWPVAWSLRSYADDHPLLRNRTPVTPTEGAFRVATWGGGADRLADLQLQVHIERSDGTWQPILRRRIEKEAEAETTGHDATFPPLDISIPRLARLELPAGRYPDFTTSVRIESHAYLPAVGRADLPSTGGEFYLELSDFPEGTSQLTISVCGGGFEEHEFSIAVDDLDRVIDLGLIELKPRPPTRVRFVDDVTGVPVEGVVWSRWESSANDRFLLHLDGGRSDSAGRTLVYMGAGRSEVEIVPPSGLEVPEDAWELDGVEPDSTGTVVVRLLHLEQQSVRIVDGAGRPRAGVIVRDGEGGVSSVTDADGRAVVHGRADWKGAWHIVVQSAAQAGGWSFRDDSWGYWSFPEDGVPVSAGPLATIVAPHHAPYWVQTWSHGVAVEGVPLPPEYERDSWFLAHPDRPGLFRIDVALLGPRAIDLHDAKTGVSRHVQFDHPGPDRTVHIDLSPATITGRVVDADGASVAGVAIRATVVQQPGEADGVPLESGQAVSENGRFRLSVTQLGKPLLLTFDAPGFVTETHEVDALGPGEWFELEEPFTLMLGLSVSGGPHGPRGALRISLAQAATESRRVQIWPADAKVAGDDWVGVRTVHPGKLVVLTGLLEGDYELEIMGVRHVLRTVAVTIIAGETVELVLEKD